MPPERMQKSVLALLQQRGTVSSLGAYLRQFCIRVEHMQGQVSSPIPASLRWVVSEILKLSHAQYRAVYRGKDICFIT